MQHEQEAVARAREELARRKSKEGGAQRWRDGYTVADAMAPGADVGLVVRVAEEEARRGRWHEAAHLYALAASRGALYDVDRRRLALLRLGIGNHKTYAQFAREEFRRCRPDANSYREVLNSLLLSRRRPGGIERLRPGPRSCPGAVGRGACVPCEEGAADSGAAL